MKKLELIFGEENNYFVREAFNTLRTNILFCGTSVKVIVITSCYAHEGKTTIAMELSRSLAQSDRRVLMVDADLRMSLTAGRYTKERGIVGLSQLLSGQTTLEKCIYHTQCELMDIVFAGPYPPNPAELVGSEAFENFIQCVREQYDYVIIDAPPLGLVIDSAVMAKYCDGSILLINKGKVRYRAAQSVKEQLEKSGCKCLGVVINHISKTADESNLRRQQASHRLRVDEAPVRRKRRVSAPSSAPTEAPAPMAAPEQKIAEQPKGEE